ncbi:CHASE2 domain-containing protein [Paraburkholderia phytofirmans]|uniref:CHASE2 domain-containing protein n=1 Tax=Paraburkholderia phytofirmans TaxID=261302 RepID=UPI0038B6EACD
MTTHKKKRGPKGEKVEGIEWLHLLGRAALSVLLGLALAVVVPTRFTEEMGAQTMARYAAPFSGYLFDTARGKAAAKDPVQWKQREITVLAIDREALRARGEGWPARYPFYSWLLGYLNEYRPTGLFIDVILSQPRNKDCDGGGKAAGFGGVEKAKACYCTNDIDDFGDFRQTLTGLTSNKIPVFLAARREPDNTLVTNAALDSDSELKSLRRVGVEFSAHSVDRLAWTYPLVYAGKEPGDTETTHPVSASAAVPDLPEQSKGRCTASAAFAIFSDMYDEGKKFTVPCNETKSMSITWPLDTAADGLLWQEPADEESEARHHMPRILRADLGDDDDEMYCTSSGQLSTLLKRAEARALFRPTSRPLCVHYRTIHASQLERMSPEDLGKAFSNHFVMIGTSFAYSNDLILSPLQDRIPGVFLHAVALDNLLSRGEKLENVEAWELDSHTSANRWGRLLLLGAIGFGLIFFTVLLKKEARKKFARFHRERTHWRKPLHLHWWAAKGVTAAFNITLFVTSFIVLVAFGVVMILLGNWMLVPFLLISHVLACTIAVEWLEWSEHLFNWITDSKED